MARSTYVYLIITIILWSTTPVFAKLALAELDNYQLLFYMSITGTLSLLLVLISMIHIPSFTKGGSKWSGASFLLEPNIGFTL